MSGENTQGNFAKRNYHELNLLFGGVLLAFAQTLFFASTESGNPQKKKDVATPGLLAGLAGFFLLAAALKVYRLSKKAGEEEAQPLVEEEVQPPVSANNAVSQDELKIKLLSAIGLTLICAAMAELVNGAVDAIDETAMSKLTVAAMSLFATHMAANLYRLVQNSQDFAGAMLNNVVGMAGVLSFFIVNGEAVSRLEGHNKIPPALALGAASMFALIMGHGTLSLLASRKPENTTVNEAREPEAAVVDVSAASNKVSLFSDGQLRLPGGIPSRAAGIGPSK